jgi:hypothetical protein
MSASTRKTLVPSLAVSLVLAAPQAVIGQSVSSRPASIALNVVVPSRASGELATIDDVTVINRTDSALDVQAIVGIANRTASRVEVRLGAGWSPDSTRVLVQNRTGEFEPLASATPIIAATTPASSTDPRSRLRFRLESERRMPAGLSIPIEYRVTLGQGDQIAVWTVPARLHIGGKR